MSSYNWYVYRVHGITEQRHTYQKRQAATARTRTLLFLGLNAGSSVGDRVRRRPPGTGKPNRVDRSPEDDDAASVHPDARL